MRAIDPEKVLADFIGGRLDPREFPHREHVRVSYELLRRHSFPEALLHLAQGLRQLAAKAGHPEAYHETITAAFLSLIGERQSKTDYADFDQFAQENPDLMQKDLLSQFYPAAVLKSRIARETFVLPRWQVASAVKHTVPASQA